MDVNFDSLFDKGLDRKETDYYVDGLLICGECNTPKQRRIDVNGQVRIIPDVCLCEQAKRDEEKRVQNENKRAAHILTWRRECFKTFGNDAERIGGKMRFDLSQSRSGAEAKCLQYAERFTVAREKNYGMVLYGNVGAGKTYLAGCICNKVIEEGYTAVFCNLVPIAQKVVSIKESDREEASSILRSADLIVLDDFGVERKTEYMDEAVQTAVDIRYQTGKPIIITTNLKPEDFKNPKNISQQRVFSRIIEMCKFIPVEGADRRKTLHNVKNREFGKDIEGLE